MSDTILYIVGGQDSRNILLQYPCSKHLIHLGFYSAYVVGFSSHDLSSATQGSHVNMNAHNKETAFPPKKQNRGERKCLFQLLLKNTQS